MKNKIKNKIYFEPPKSIQENLQRKLFPKPTAFHWKRLIPAMTICLFIGVVTYKYLNRPAPEAYYDEAYVELFFEADEMQDQGIEEFATNTTQEDEAAQDEESAETLI